jgi:hypothetical protein
MGETHQEIRCNGVALDRLRAAAEPYDVPPDELLRELRRHPRKPAGTA